MKAYDIVQKRSPYLIARSGSGDFGILDGEFNVVERGITRLDDAIATVKRLQKEDDCPPEPPEETFEDESPEDDILEDL